MNRINSAEREKVAAEYEGEAERIRIVAKARAEAESKRLHGRESPTKDGKLPADSKKV